MPFYTLRTNNCLRKYFLIIFDEKSFFTMSKNIVESILWSKESTLTEMLKAGVQFGHRSSKWNPKMEPYLSGVKNNVHIINLERSFEKFLEALNFISGIVAEGKNILFVGTRTHAKKITENAAKEMGMSYVVERWIGGTFTNFPIISKRLEYFRDLEKKAASGELEKYTKKEKHLFLKELQALNLKWGGIKEMTKLPDAVFIVDIVHDKLAVKEAKEKGIKVIAFCDTNADPTLVDFPIPANDDSISSLSFLFGKIIEVVKKTKETIKGSQLLNN